MCYRFSISSRFGGSKLKYVYAYKYTVYIINDAWSVMRQRLKQRKKHWKFELFQLMISFRPFCFVCHTFWVASFIFQSNKYGITNPLHGASAALDVCWCCCCCYCSASYVVGLSKFLTIQMEKFPKMGVRERVEIFYRFKHVAYGNSMRP